MTGWTHVKHSLGMGLEEQWIFRPRDAPLCSLRRSTDDQWQSRLLTLELISVNVLWLSGALTLEEAKRASEDELRHMGHEWEKKGATDVGKVEDNAAPGAKETRP